MLILSFTFPSDICHTRGPIDGSLYAQVRKRRGLGATTSPASPNGCLTTSPTVNPESASKPQPFSFNSNSRASTASSGPMVDTSPPTNCSDSPQKKGEAEKQKPREKERDRETAILDDGDPSSPGTLWRERSCCSRSATKCSDAGWERDRELCLSNGHCPGRCNSVKKHPKSQTLPALPFKSLSPPPHLTHMEIFHHHSTHPLPELPWERPINPPSMPCLHGPCCPYPSPEHAHSHSHTLPASNRVCAGEECHLFHYPSHAAHPSRPLQPGSPYRDIFFNSGTSTSYCSCQDCSSRREQQSASVRRFPQPHPDHSENPHWSQGIMLQQTRETPPIWETEKPWELMREAEFWQSKPSMPVFHLCHSTLEQVPNPEQPRHVIIPHQSYPGPQSLMDVRDGASSGYHTPLQPRHSCPCSPYPSSPSESRESRGYVSGYHSGSASPLPASSPSPGRSRHPDASAGSGDQSHSELHRGEYQASSLLVLHDPFHCFIPSNLYCHRGKSEDRCRRWCFSRF